MKLGLLKLRNNGVTMSSKQALMESIDLHARNQQIEHNKYDEIRVLTNRMITHNTAKKRLGFFEIQELITDIGHWLDIKEAKVKFMLVFVDPKKLMQTQKVLIELGTTLLEFCDFAQDAIRERYYQLLTKILRRSELDLSYLEITKSKQTEESAEQVAILTAYCFFVVKLLKKVIVSLKQRQIETYKRDFLEDAIATCFFRQPKFRAFMLQHADSGFF